MRKRAFWLAAALSVGLMVSGASLAQEVTNMLTNGGFESGPLAPYGTYATVTTTVVTEVRRCGCPGRPIEGKYCLHVVVPAAGTNSWDMYMVDASLHL